MVATRNHLKDIRRQIRLGGQRAQVEARWEAAGGPWLALSSSFPGTVTQDPEVEGLVSALGSLPLSPPIRCPPAWACLFLPFCTCTVSLPATTFSLLQRTHLSVTPPKLRQLLFVSEMRG